MSALASESDSLLSDVTSIPDRRRTAAVISLSLCFVILCLLLSAACGGEWSEVSQPTLPFGPPNARHSQVAFGLTGYSMSFFGGKSEFISYAKMEGGNHKSGGGGFPGHSALESLSELRAAGAVVLTLLLIALCSITANGALLLFLYPLKLYPETRKRPYGLYAGIASLAALLAAFAIWCAVGIGAATELAGSSSSAPSFSFGGATFGGSGADGVHHAFGWCFIVLSLAVALTAVLVAADCYAFRPSLSRDSDRSRAFDESDAAAGGGGGERHRAPPTEHLYQAVAVSEKTPILGARTTPVIPASAVVSIPTPALVAAPPVSAPVPVSVSFRQSSISPPHAGTTHATHASPKRPATESAQAPEDGAVGIDTTPLDDDSALLAPVQ